MHRILQRGLSFDVTAILHTAPGIPAESAKCLQVFPSFLHLPRPPNNFHVFRSVCIARKRAGLSHISGIPAPYPSVLLPHYMMREFFTITVDTLLGNTI